MNGSSTRRPADDAGTGRHLSAVFSTYRKAREAAGKLSAIRAEQIGVGLAEPKQRREPARTPRSDSGADAEFAGEWPPYEGEYRLTAVVPDAARERAERIVRDCGGRLS